MGCVGEELRVRSLRGERAGNDDFHFLNHAPPP